MDRFKIRVGNVQSYEITVDNFEAETGKKGKYIAYNRKGEKRYHAVCPLCDNPIQIIGLYKKHPEGKKPYGKHFAFDVPGIAAYDEDAYWSCPYKNPSRENIPEKRKSENLMSLNLYNTLKNQFDRIIYVWNKTTGIRISNAFAEKLLIHYVEDEGWRYYDANYNNLPYMLLYAEKAYSLIGRLIDKNSNIYTELLKKSGKYEIIDYGDNFGKVINKTGLFLTLEFYLTKHKFRVEGEHLHETFDLVVKENESIIISEKIEVDSDILTRLFSLPIEKAKRNEELLKIAERIM